MSSILKVDKIVSQTGATPYLENGTLKNVVIDSSCTFGPGRSDQFIVKHKFCSATTVDQSFTSGTGTAFLDGAEIDMGIPAKANNWYRGREVKLNLRKALHGFCKSLHIFSNMFTPFFLVEEIPLTFSKMKKLGECSARILK